MLEHETKVVIGVWLTHRLAGTGLWSSDVSLSDVERGLVARYAARVLERGEMPLRSARQLIFWLNDRSELLNLPLPKPLSRTVGNIYSGNFNPGEFEQAYRQSRKELVAGLQAAAEETEPPSPLAENAALLIKELGLPEAAWKILGLVACYTRYDQVQYFCDTVTEVISPMSRAIASIIGEPSRIVEELLSPTGELIAAGLLQAGDGEDIAGGDGRYTIPTRVDSCLDRTYENFAEMRRNLLGEAHDAGIHVEDYQHVASDRDLVAQVLEGASRDGARGVNVLLYGPPGTGKTELTKVAAGMAGIALYGAGEEVGSHGESDRSERLADLVFSLRLLAESKKTALLFDEMEDIAWQLMRRGGSKVYLNRLLENNPVPVLWTSNNIHEIDPALLRRMTLAVELKLPPPAQRQRILQRLCCKYAVEVSDEEAARLSRRIAATPAVLENAVKAARLSGGGAEALERSALGIVRAVSGETIHRPGTFADFDPKLTCASMDLLALTSQLVEGSRAAFSLCLSGPAGTGKSAYARYLARRLGLEVIQKRASDLLGAFVGESEKRIADAFEEARETGGLLIFDEADSLLLDRKDAVRSWEITQVNEMLTWMEEHPFPVCFTTNLMDRLDTASLRRFTFHVRFDYLDRAALKRAFESFFRMRTVPAQVLDLANLTPGDFARARKQAEVLGQMDDAARIADLLMDISHTKPAASASIGFMRP